MKKIPDRYLPIGTVVMLKGGTKRLMISGFCAVQSEEKEEQKIWDYCGCIYPEGFFSSKQFCLFDHNQIKEIYHLGLSGEDDEEEKDFKEKLNQVGEILDKNADIEKPKKIENTPRIRAKSPNKKEKKVDKTKK